MELFKVRSSGTSEIMNKTGLGETGMTHIKNWLKQEEFGRRKEIKSKYLDKGNRNEEEGFTMLAVNQKLGMVRKNVDFFENEWSKGTPDLIHKGIVYDNKASWDLSTFPMYDLECKVGSKYWWQLQDYMWLTKCPKSVLSYTLSNADHELIEREIKWIVDMEAKQTRIQEMVFTKDAWGAAIEKFCQGIEVMDFIEIPENRRIKLFEVPFDKTIMTRIPERVTECRKIIETLTVNN